MSAFNQYSKTYTIADGLTANFGTDIQFQIRDRSWWLAGIDILATVKLGAAISGGTADHLSALVSRVTLSADEGEDGQRNIVDANGAALVDFGKQVTGFVDRTTSAGHGTAGTSGSILAINYPILFMNPIVTQPASYALCLPLPRYGTDPTLRISIAPKASVASTFTLDGTWVGAKVQVRLNYVEVIDPKNDFPAIKSALLTTHDKFAWAATGRRAIDDVTQGGVLLGLLQQDYSTSARAFCVDAGSETYTLEYRGRNIREENPYMLQNLNDCSAVYATGAYSNSCSLYWDFLAERSLTDAFAFRSGLDLSADTLAGGKLRLIASHIATSTNQSRITVWKLMENRAKLNAIMA